MLVLVVSHSPICMEAGRKEFTAHSSVLAAQELIWCVNRFTPIANGLHMKLWGTWVQNTVAYVQSMEQKSLPKNSKYWLRETQICDRSWYEKLQHKWNGLNHYFELFLTNTWNFWVNSFVPYFIHMLKCFTLMCLKVSCVIHWLWKSQFGVSLNRFTPITHDTWRHMSVKHFSICIKYGTKDFTQKFQVLVRKSSK